MLNRFRGSNVAVFGRVYIALKLYTAEAACDFPHRSRWRLSDSSPIGIRRITVHSADRKSSGTA
jgi:hypothetical protein